MKHYLKIVAIAATPVLLTSCYNPFSSCKSTNDATNQSNNTANTAAAMVLPMPVWIPSIAIDLVIAKFIPVKSSVLIFHLLFEYISNRQYGHFIKVP